MGVNTGLGWECPSGYLVNDADTDLGWASSRHFYKTHDGYAFAFYSISAAGWRGPVLVSTEAENVEHYYGDSNLGVLFSFRHLKRTWYVGNMHHMNTSDYGTGVLMPINTTAVNEAQWKAELVQIMNRVGVKNYVSWRGLSFMAGLAAGLAARAWAYMGEIAMGLISKFISHNGTYNAAADGVDGYSTVVVNVPNSYTAVDEGKVVVYGALAVQTPTTVTANGTYDTTDNNSVTVSIPAASGEVF